MHHPQLKSWLILLLALLAIAGYSTLPSDAKISFSLRRIHVSLPAAPQDTAVSDTLVAPPPKKEKKEGVMDTTRQVILFFGDSMLEGLARRMSSYAGENGHTLHYVCWYGSSTQAWAGGKTLDVFLQKYKPTFVMICLGSNELYVRDIHRREQYVDDILSRLGDTPYVWIGPPAWRKDTGIIDVIRKKVGEKRFYESTRLKYQRGKDHMHPTFNSAYRWMDSVAVWMSSAQTLHPIRMKVPAEKHKPASAKYLQTSFTGYETLDAAHELK